MVGIAAESFVFWTNVPGTPFLGVWSILVKFSKLFKGFKNEYIGFNFCNMLGSCNSIFDMALYSLGKEVV